MTPFSHLLTKARFARIGIVMALGAATFGCTDKLPAKVPLKPEGAAVEIIHEAPNKDVYERAGTITAKIVGRELESAKREGFNHLRNEAAAKGAAFVAIEDISAQSAWDLSGRTVVTLEATSYRAK